MILNPSPLSIFPLRFWLEERVFTGLRWYYQLRFPRLQLDPGVRIGGKIRLSGQVSVRIHHGTRIRKRVHFFGKGHITIGANCLLNGCSIGCYEQVAVGDRCLLSDCYIVDSDFHNVDPERRHDPPLPQSRRPIRIEKNVWVASGARILKGVEVGENSVVGLSCVVRRDVPANVVVIGNPEQVVKHLPPEPPLQVSVNKENNHEATILSGCGRE